MRPPDPELDAFLDRLCQRVRTTTTGAIDVHVEKLSGMLIIGEIETGEMRGSLARSMAAQPCRREAQADVKRQRRGR